MISPYITCWGIMAFTFFFFLAISSLFITQLKNFMSNRTTNERFSRKAYANTSNRSQSMMSMTTSILAEELVNDMGKPLEIDSKVACFKNMTEMCCIDRSPSQVKLYDGLLQSKNNRHRNDSVLNGGLD
jgi:hypothetical protein